MDVCASLCGCVCVAGREEENLEHDGENPAVDLGAGRKIQDAFRGILCQISGTTAKSSPTDSRNPVRSASGQ